MSFGVDAGLGNLLVGLAHGLQTARANKLQDRQQAEYEQDRATQAARQAQFDAQNAARFQREQTTFDENQAGLYLSPDEAAALNTLHSVNTFTPSMTREQAKSLHTILMQQKAQTDLTGVQSDSAAYLKPIVPAPVEATFQHVTPGVAPPMTMPDITRMPLGQTPAMPGPQLGQSPVQPNWMNQVTAPQTTMPPLGMRPTTPNAPLPNPANAPTMPPPTITMLAIHG